MGSAARQEAQREGGERPGVQGWVLRLGPSHALQAALEPQSLCRSVSAARLPEQEGGRARSASGQNTGKKIISKKQQVYKNIK